MADKREAREFTTLANATVLIALLVFLVMFSPLNNVSGLLVKKAPVTYPTHNIPLEGLPDSGCYDSDAPTGIETLKTQIYTAGLVDSEGGKHYDVCNPADERQVEENVCTPTKDGVQREPRLVTCPQTMMCQQGRCVR